MPYSNLVKIDIFFLLQNVQVQDDLRQLREKMSNGDGNINMSDLDRALAKTEEGLQVHVLQYIV